MKRYRGYVGLIEDQMKALKEYCDSKTEEDIKREMKRRHDASKRRHEEALRKEKEEDK